MNFFWTGIRIQNAGKKYGNGPSYFDGPRGVSINDWFSPLIGRYGSGYRRAFFGRLVQRRNITPARFSVRSWKQSGAAFALNGTDELSYVEGQISTRGERTLNAGSRFFNELFRVGKKFTAINILRANK